MTDSSRGPLPVVPFLKIPAEGEPYLEGCVCRRCDTTYLGERMACSKCGAREGLEAKRLGKRGTLHTYSIVHRSFPGVSVPFISAVVDLEDGVSLKGNLIHVAPDPEHIRFGMPVELTFADALGRKDREGNSYLSYFFQPRSDAR